jgi:hypothetical protein
MQAILDQIDSTVRPALRAYLAAEHLVGAREHGRRRVEAERLGGREIEDELARL